MRQKPHSNKWKRIRQEVREDRPHAPIVVYEVKNHRTIRYIDGHRYEGISQQLFLVPMCQRHLYKRYKKSN